MNMNVVWPTWFLASMAAFAVLEAYALQTGRETLTSFVRTLSADLGVFQFLSGLVVGGLAVHFWWAYGK
jgi:hypothetical protein